MPADGLPVLFDPHPQAGGEPSSRHLALVATRGRASGGALRLRPGHRLVGETAWWHVLRSAACRGRPDSWPSTATRTLQGPEAGGDEGAFT